MPRFKVAWRYESAYGVFAEGDVTEVDAELAEAINRDSPGVLEAVEDDAPLNEAPKEDPVEREARRGRVGGTATKGEDAPEGEAMSTADGGAVKQAEDAEAPAEEPEPAPEPEPEPEPPAEKPKPAPKRRSRKPKGA